MHEDDAEADEPAVRGGPGQHDRADFFRDRAEGVAGLDDRGAFGDCEFGWLCHAFSGLEPHFIYCSNAALKGRSSTVPLGLIARLKSPAVHEPN